MGLGFSARRDLLEKYYEKHNNKDVFERVAIRQNIRSVAKGMMSSIMQCYFSKAPVETGYGRSAGIRYTQEDRPVASLGGRRKRYRGHFTIIIGSEKPAHGGETFPHAPYMAIQNILPSNEGWINEATHKARGRIKSYGFAKYMYINNPLMTAHYITNNGTNRPSGYKIGVIFIDE